MTLPDLSGWNSSQLATLIMGIFLVQSAGMIIVLVRFWGARIDAREANQNAQAANMQTVKTGNGFAAHVLESLDKIKDAAAITHAAMEKMQAAQVEQKNEMQNVSERVARIDEHQRRHLEHHLDQERRNA